MGDVTEDKALGAQDPIGNVTYETSVGNREGGAQIAYQ